MLGVVRSEATFQHKIYDTIPFHRTNPKQQNNEKKPRHDSGNTNTDPKQKCGIFMVAEQKAERREEARVKPTPPMNDLLKILRS